MPLLWLLESNLIIYNVGWKPGQRLVRVQAGFFVLLLDRVRDPYHRMW